MQSTKARVRPSPFDLNDAQAAFCREDHHSICIACPGSGKTRALLSKTARLATSIGAARVMAITFTRAAAQEMRERLHRLLGSNAQAIRLFTFHGLAYRQLSAHQPVRIVSDAESHGLLLRAKERAGSTLGLDALTEAVSRFKRHLDPATLAEGSEDAFAVFTEYQRAMKAHGVMDMDDLMLALLRGYEDGSIKPFDLGAMLIDEFQDCDEVQLRVALHYGKRDTRVHVVADDDQSIYGFRAGLGFHAIDRLRATLDAKQFLLDQNYRCTPQIVALADRVIQHNRLRFPKLLRSASKLSGEPCVLEASSPFSEAEAIVKAHNAGVPLTVLARVNQWLDPIELMAISAGLSVRRTGNTTFLSRAHVTQAIAALRLALEPSDSLALLSVLQLSSLGFNTLTALENALPSESISSALSLLYESSILVPLSKDDSTRVRELRSVLGEWIDAASRASIGSVRERGRLLNVAVTALLKSLNQFVSSEWHKQDIATLSRLIAERMEGPLAGRVRTLGEWARRMQRKGKDERALRLMSIHSAKGLEFDRVWLAGCNERVLPYDGSNVEEERRLFYVATTRAKASLTISYVREQELQPSRFVLESGVAPITLP